MYWRFIFIVNVNSKFAHVSDPFQRNCDANSTSEWFLVNDLPIPHQQIDPGNAELTSKSCQSMCDRQPQCYGFSSSQILNGTCETFLQSSTYSYRHASYSNYPSVAFVKLCDTGNDE